MVVTLNPEQQALVAALSQAAATAIRERDLVLTAIRAAQGPGEFKGFELTGNQLRFLDAE